MSFLTGVALYENGLNCPVMTIVLDDVSEHLSHTPNEIRQALGPWFGEHLKRFLSLLCHKKHQQPQEKCDVFFLDKLPEDKVQQLRKITIIIICDIICQKNPLCTGTELPIKNITSGD